VSQEGAEVDFVLDGGASANMLGRCGRAAVGHLTEEVRNIYPAAGSPVPGVVCGFERLTAPGDSEVRLETDGIFSPHLRHNLLSERRLLRAGWRISRRKRWLYAPSGSRIKIEWRSDNLFHVVFRIGVRPRGDAESAAVSVSEETWHRRMGHLCRRTGGARRCSVYKPVVRVAARPRRERLLPKQGEGASGSVEACIWKTDNECTCAQGVLSICRENVVGLSHYLLSLCKTPVMVAREARRWPVVLVECSACEFANDEKF